MHPTLVEQMAQHRIDSFDREAEADRRAALAKRAPKHPWAVRDRVTRVVVRLGLTLRRSPA